MRSAVFSNMKSATAMSMRNTHMVGESASAVRASWFHLVSLPLPSMARRSTG